MADDDDIEKRFADGLHKLTVEIMPDAEPEEILAVLIGTAYGYASKLGLSKLAFHAHVHKLLGSLVERADA